MMDDESGLAPVGVLSRVYIDKAVSTAVGTVYSFTVSGFGTEASDRYTVLAITHGGTGSQTVSSVTINGAAADLHANVVNGTMSRWQGTCLAIAYNPSDDALAVEVTMTGSQSRCTLDIYAVFAIDSTTPVATISDTDNSNPQTGSLATSIGGIAIGVAAERTVGSYTWSGLTEDSDYQYDTASRTSSAASATTSGASISVSSTFSTTVDVPSLSAASWR